MIEKLLEQILYELRVANYQASGGKTKPPVTEDQEAVRVNGEWQIFHKTKAL